MRIPFIQHLICLVAVVFVRATAAEEAPQEVKVSILTPTEQPVSVEQIEKLATGAKVTRTEEPAGTVRFTAEWPDAVVHINFKSEYDHETQSKGALGFVSRFPEENRETGEAKQLIKFIPSIRQAYGVVLPRGFDRKGNASALLRDLAKHLDGYLISKSSFYDSRGFRVLGHPFESPFLGFSGRGISSLDKPIPAKELLAGSWDVTLSINQAVEDAAMHLWLQSVDEFGADGSHRSKGTAEITITPPDAEEGFAMSFDFESTGRWEEKDGKLVMHSEKTTTANHKAADEELKEVIEEIAAEMRKTTDPDVCWMLVRDRNLIVLEENETGVTGQMKRKEAAVPPKSPDEK